MSESKQLQQLMEQNQARMKALHEAFRSQMSALVNETASAIQTLTRIDREFELSESRIQEHQEIISHHQEQLSQLRETGTAMEAKIASLYTELSEQQQQIATLKATVMETQGRIEIVENDAEKRRAQLTKKEKNLEEKQRELGRLNAGRDQEIARFKEAVTQAKKKIKGVKKENPVADFLLSEGLEPPELDILAVLIHRKEVPVIDIKRIVKTPPAITTRVLKEMENKGILELTSTDQVQLKITVE